MYVAMTAGGVVRNNNQTIARLGAGAADFENFYAGDGNDTVLGNALANEILGGRGNDSLRGGKGNDLLEGSDQNDKLLGGTGSDYLSGGRGNDLSTGNVGRDTFVFRGNMGTDRVTDFADDIDTLQFDNALWGNTNKSVSQVIASYGDVVGSDTVFDFGGGNKVTIVGVTNVNVFLNDITII